MPEVRFTIRWPDGTEEACYSPSTVIHAHLSAGTAYPLPDFVDRARRGLQAASDRVQARFGHPCAAARAEQARIVARAAPQSPDGQVLCLSLT